MKKQEEAKDRQVQTKPQPRPETDRKATPQNVQSEIDRLMNMFIKL